MTSQTGRIQRAGALAIFLVTTIVIVLGAWAAFMHYRGDMLQTEEDDLLAISQLKQTNILEHLKERLGDAEVFAARKPVVELLAPAPKGAPMAEAHSQVPGAIELTVRTYGYRRIVILDRDARPVFPRGIGTMDPAVMAAVEKVRATQTPGIVDLYRTDRGEMAYGAVAPVRRHDDDTTIIGFVFLQADANAKLYRALDWPTPSLSGEALLIKRDGEDVVWLSPLRHRREMMPLDTRLPMANERMLGARALSGQVGIINNVVDYRGTEVVGAASPIEGTPWILISKMDRAEIENDLNELTHVIIVLAGVFIIIAAGVSVLIWRTSRLEAAQEQAELAHQYQTAIATTTDAFIRLDGNARLVEVNQALSHMTGYTHSELMTLGLRELEGAESPEETEAHLAAIRKAGSARFETQWRRKDGTLVDLDVSTVYVRRLGSSITPTCETSRNRSMSRAG